jgi:hypothetical protein
MCTQKKSASPIRHRTDNNALFWPPLKIRFRIVVKKGKVSDCDFCLELEIETVQEVMPEPTFSFVRCLHTVLCVLYVRPVTFLSELLFAIQFFFCARARSALKRSLIY